MLGSEGFSWDLTEGVYSGYTIAYVGLQVAVYMGFKEIFYLGLDLKDKGKQTHFFGQDFRSLNHDHTEFQKMKRMFEHTVKLFAKTDVRVCNCGEDCELDCIPKVSYEHAVSL